MSSAINETLALNIKGMVECYKTTNGVTTKEFSQNLIVKNASEIIRDLVFGKKGEAQAPRLKYLVLGDANLTSASEAETLQAPTLQDKTLINPTLWIPLEATDEYSQNTITSTQYEGMPAIEFKVVISQAQGNTDKGFFVELGLAIDNADSPDSYLFSRLVRTKAISKTSDDEITLIYRVTF